MGRLYDWCVRRKGLWSTINFPGPYRRHNGIPSALHTPSTCTLTLAFFSGTCQYLASFIYYILYLCIYIYVFTGFMYSVYSIKIYINFQLAVSWPKLSCEIPRAGKFGRFSFLSFHHNRGGSASWDLFSSQ